MRWGQVLRRTGKVLYSTSASGERLTSRPAGVLAAGVFLAALALAGPAAGAVAFQKSNLAGESSTNPTSLQFGPDGRLYVAQLNGQIKAYTIQRNGPDSYSVTDTEPIDHIKNIQNHDDDGTPNNGVNERIVTGILVVGTAANPVIYATSSDPRIGGGVGGNQKGDLGLDTNSSMVSKLTKSGSGWTKVDLVRGLPRSEENHSANGLQLDPATNTLYVAQGGNTNLGAPSNGFAELPEYALSAAILAIDLDVIGNTTYDIPTLNDEERPGTNDANDPFGGNDGKNQAKLLAGGPVQVYAPGFRNPYDLLRHSNGKMYTIDNGANANWGDVPAGCTNDVKNGGSTIKDSLHIVTKGYYGGHPNPTRGSKTNTFNPTSPQSPIATANAKECTFVEPTKANGALETFQPSTNGLAEYKASNFDGELKGNLIAAAFDGKIFRLKLNGAGTAVTLKETTNFLTADALPLDVTAQGDAGPFPGTIWAADYLAGGGTVTVYEPVDSGVCKGTRSKLDEDGDEFTNADELDNRTDPCNPSSYPPDADGDKISDLNDPDDDNDGIPDTRDAFALDPENGRQPLPVRFDWNIDDVAGGLHGTWGFTGLMTNGRTDYRHLYKRNHITTPGAAGLFTVERVAKGDAWSRHNNQKHGFQFGVKAPSRQAFVAHTRVLPPFFNGRKPKNHQSMGLFFGKGDQDNYVKVVVAANGGRGGIEFVKEVRGKAVKLGSKRLKLSGAQAIDLYLRVNPRKGKVQASYVITRRGDTGRKINVTRAKRIKKAPWLRGGKGLAVGIISTSRGKKTPAFPATWDLIEVKRAR